MDASPRDGDIGFYIAVAFLFGVFAANSAWNLAFVAILAVCFVAGLVAMYGLRNVKWVAVVLLALTAGAFYYFGFIRWQDVHTKLPAGKNAAFFGVVTEEPKAAGNFMIVPLNLLRPYAGTIDAFASPNGAPLQYGDEVWIQGSVDPSKDGGEPPAVFMPELRVIADHQGFWPTEIIIDIKDAIARKITQLLPPDQAALLAGIMIGTTGTISAALKAAMETSGTMYIVNMYGYKIAIVTAAFSAALKDHISRRTLLWITLAAIGVFILASGGSISAIRAAVMGVFAVIARGTGRVFSARNAVTFAALGMVLLNATLLSDAGFQLSFLSFLGIYYLGPPVNNLFHWTDGGALDWKSHAMLSLTTNLAILPVVMNTFGEFSLTSLLSNILIMIPWVAVITFGAIAVVLGFISQALAFPATQIVSVLLRYELFIIHLFAVIAVPMPAVFGSPFVIALYYGMLILFAHYYGAPSQENN